MVFRNDKSFRYLCLPTSESWYINGSSEGIGSSMSLFERDVIRFCRLGKVQMAVKLLEERLEAVETGLDEVSINSTHKLSITQPPIPYPHQYTHHYHYLLVVLLPLLLLQDLRIKKHASCFRSL